MKSATGEKRGLERFDLEIPAKIKIPAPGQEEEALDYIEVPIDDLAIGMRLARDVRMKSGAMVMPAMMQLNHHNLDKLKNYHSLDCITNRVFINKSDQ